MPNNFFKNKERVFALSFVFVILALTLTSCTSKTYIPEIKNSFETKALYTFGDFTYNCKITKDESSVSVLINDTNAAGMVIKCDGESVTFTQGNMKKAFPVSDIDVTNPALVLYQVFTSIETSNARLGGDGYLFSGTVSAGEYTLTVSKAGEYKALSLSGAKISVKFN